MSNFWGAVQTQIQGFQTTFLFHNDGLITLHQAAW